MRLVVTGGSGKLGRHLVPKLTREHKLLLYDKQAPAQSHFSYIKGEITNLEKLRKAFQGADAVIHLAALRSRFNHLPMKVMETNTLGTFCVLEAARTEKVKKIIFSSSDAVLGMAQSKTEFPPEYLPIDEKYPLKPQDPYGMSKLLGEEMCRCYAIGYDINIIALRFSNILCPGDEQQYLEDAKDSSIRRRFLWSWVHVEDAVHAIMNALVSTAHGFEVFYIAADDVCLLKPNVSPLLATYFPKTPTRKPLSAKESLINCSKAKYAIGFRPSKKFEELTAMQSLNPK